MSTSNILPENEALNILNQQLAEIQAKHILPGNSLEKLQTRAVVVMAIRLFPTSGIANLRRNPSFMLEYALFFESLIQLLKTKALQFHPQQHSNNLFIVFPTEHPHELSTIYQLTAAILNLAEKLNLEFEKLSIPKLKTVFALDYGSINYIFQDTLNILWLGDTLDRAEILANHASVDIFPPLLVSHSVYEQLPSEEQELFPKAYYIHHIACYGKNL